MNTEMVRSLYHSIGLSKGISTRLLFSKALVLFASFLLLLLLSLLLLSPTSSSSGSFEHPIAQLEHKMLVHVGFSSLINNGSGSTVMLAGSNNSLLYDNSTYGIRFLSPYGWNKMEILAGRTTFVEFTSPSRNVTESIDLPAQVVISIEKGLGNVTTLQQYMEAGDKLLNALLGNFTVTSQPSALIGEPAISRIIAAKDPVSGIDISMAQVFAIKNGNAYAITYTAPPSIYYSYLPIVEQVLNSFQITK